MKLFISAIFLFSFKVFAEPCNIELYSKLYKFEKDQKIQVKDIIKSSTCNDAINSNLVSLISEQKSTEVFASTIEKTIDKDVHITPRKIVVNDLSNTLHEQLVANSNLFFFDLKSINQFKTIALNEDESLRAVCDSCTGLGDRNIKIEISNPSANTMRSLWITTKIFAKAKVVKAKRTIGFQQKSLSADDFYIDETYTMMPDQLLGNIENINFYKPNKTILQGSIITNLDIQPVNLVNYGIPVKAILKSQSISLTKMAQPVRSAQYGEVVELKVGNNKSISGKVIDYNQVVIEL